MISSARAVAALCLSLTALAAFACGSSPKAPTAAEPEPSTAPTPPAPADAARPPATSPPRDPPDLVSYRMWPRMQGDELVALVVEMRFDGGDDGVTRLSVPDSWAGARQLWRHLHELRVEGATSVKAVDPITPTQWIIQSTPKAKLFARYEVRSAYQGPPKASIGQPFEPAITPTWFYAFGEAVFATVERPHHLVKFAWAKAPPGFAFASDLEHLDPAGAPVRELLDSIVIGGSAVQVHTAKGEGNERLRVALAGEYAFSPADFIDLVQAILVVPRALFKESDAPFLVAMSPLVPEGGRSIGGSSIADAFALSVSQDSPLPALGMLISHEYFHTWNPRLLGGPEREAVERRNKWFSEGFTDFYAARLLQRTGRARPEDFVADWNELLLAYASSPVRAAPAQRIEDEYWTNPDVTKLPYQRGRVLAALWDHKLRQATNGTRDLDDVLLAMRQSVGSPFNRDQLPPAAERFLAAYRAAGGPLLDDDLARYVVRGEPVELPADVFGACVRVKQVERAAFERGWDPTATTANDNVITGLRRGSAAYNAGLRDGMTIIRRLSGAPGDVTVPYSLRVLAGNRERTITFWPRGPGTLKAQQLELTAARTPASRAACSALLGGER